MRTLEAGQEVSMGNVRAQHNPKIVAGKLVAIDFDDKAKKIPVIAKITDDAEWNKVQEGTYTGFSIGGDYVKRWSDGRFIRYTARPQEVSIVDSPCMAGASFSMVKADGTTEERHFQSTDLHSVNERIAALDERIAKLNKLLDTRPEPFNPDDLHGELRKSLANGLTSDALEAKQARSPRFVPRSNRHHGPDSPWL